MREGRTFHYLQKGKHIFVCVTSTRLDRQVPFAFLNDVQSEFEVQVIETKDQDHNMFENNLNRLLRAYENHGHEDTMRMVQSSLNNVKGVMQNNIGAALERGEDLSLLEDKSTRLTEASNAFKLKSKDVERQFYWQYMKQRLLIGLVILAIIYIIIAQFCGWSLKGCTR